MTKARFVADESCDFSIVRALRAARFEVWSVAEQAPQTPDEEVLARAREMEAVLVTEDRDFGKLVFASCHGARGVLLVRYPASKRERLGRTVVELVERFGAELETGFVTLTERGARYRRLPGL